MAADIHRSGLFIFLFFHPLIFLFISPFFFFLAPSPYRYCLSTLKFYILPFDLQKEGALMTCRITHCTCPCPRSVYDPCNAACHLIHPQASHSPSSSRLASSSILAVCFFASSRRYSRPHLNPLNVDPTIKPNTIARPDVRHGNRSAHSEDSVSSRPSPGSYQIHAN